jgi:transposase
MKLSMIKERGPLITVIGAISAERGLIHTQIYKENNNALHFQQFLFALKAKCAGRRVVVILDNLRVHHAKILSDVYTDDFEELFLPPYSSVLNPIERLWALLKRRWTQQLYQFSDYLAQLPNKKQNVPLETIRRLQEILGKCLRSFNSNKLKGRSRTT